MLRRTLATLGLLLATQALASEKLPDLSGPQDPSQFVARENALRRAINGNFLLRDGSDPIVPDTRYNLGLSIRGLNPKDYGAVGDGVADDAAALLAGCTAASAAGVPLVLALIYRVASNQSFTCDLAFAAGALLAPDSGRTISHAGSAYAADAAWIFGGSGAVTSTTPYRSVKWWGAGRPGSTDDAPGFRSALASNTYIKVPPASYTFTSRTPGPPTAFDDIGVHVLSKSNFVIDAYDAKITMNNANAFASWIHIDSSSNFQLRGMECVGNRTGLSAGQENSCFTLSNVVNFTVRDIYASGNWGGLGTISAGDWMVNGLIENIRGDAVGQCFDYAFLKGVTIRTVRAKGADTNGNQGAGQIGQKCFSNIYDVPNAGNNVTGVSFTDTSGVALDDFDVSNFGTGWLISSGQNYTLTNSNRWHDNPGLGATKGIGGYITYFNGGSASSVGFPPGRITDRSRYTTNGAATAGAGVYINSGDIVNGDVITNIDIDGTFDNNADTGVNTISSAHLSGLMINGIFSGAGQTTAVSSQLSSVAGAVITGYGVSPRFRLANNSPLVSRNAANNADVSLIQLDGSNNLSVAPAGGLIYTGGTLRAGGVLAASIDYVQLSPGATGVGAAIGCFSGTDTNVACNHYTQGSGNHNFLSGAGLEAAFIASRAGLYLPGSSSGNALYAATATGGLLLKANATTVGSSDAAGNFTFATPLILTQASPASGAACTAGQITVDTGFFYACAASGQWKRAALTGGY